MSSPEPILVTGGSGYLASWIVKLLLEDGHEVRATVRDLSDTRKNKHLLELQAKTGRLSLFQAELQSEKSFEEAMGGCAYVVHTASPFRVSGVKDAERELIRPAVNGVRNVLGSVNRTDSVRRVVLTSSTVAVYGDCIEARGRGPFTEADWNTTSSAEHQPYPFSKTLAEKSAWEMTREQTRWALITLLPGFILGPAIDPGTSGVSNTIMQDVAGGKYKSGMIDLWYGIVDVRDVARAHIRACFQANASGRYIISARSASLFEVAQILGKEFGEDYPIPTRKAPKWFLWLLAPRFGFPRKFIARNAGYPIQLDNRRSINELMMTYTPIETAIREHFQQAISVEDSLSKIAD